MGKPGNVMLNILSWIPIVWIVLSYFFYLINFNPRLIFNEHLDELMLYWFFRYFILFGIPLWLILVIYKGVTKRISGKRILFHVLLLTLGFATLFLMMELNPHGWVNQYFD
jgi:hypothetical protein